MRIEGYLVIRKTGMVRFVKNCPGLDWNEISMKINMVVPDALFRKPTLSAKIVVPEDAATLTEIPAEVIESCKEAIQTATGMKVIVELVPEKVLGIDKSVEEKE
jgi:hypothetical protein